MSTDKPKLFDSDEEDELPDKLDFNCENSYAQKYNDWRRKEELQKLKDKYGDNLDIMSEIDQSDGETGEEDGESESSDEDSSSESVEDPFDDDFFNVYSALRNKDSKIYDKSFNFFNENNNNDEQAEKKSKNKESKQNKMTLGDYHRKLIEEKKGITEEDEMMMNGDNSDDEERKPAGYYEDLYNIRKEINQIVNEDSEDDNLFSVKNVPTKSAQRADNGAKSFTVLNIWKEGQVLDEGEKFLKDYILNKKYLDDRGETKSATLNDFNNVESHFGGFENTAAVPEDEGGDCEEPKCKIESAKYHFEEPDANVIKRYPRTIASVRDTVNTTKKSRKAELREVKKKEKESELRNLRKFKREEIEKKIEKLKEISGNQSLDINDLDLNVIVDDQSEFDAEKYDEKMRLLFGDGYYSRDEGGEKPQFEYIAEIDDNLYEDEEIDVEDLKPSNVATGNKVTRKKKKKEAAKRDIMKDDSIGLYEDLIGGEIATRFRYRMVEPNDYGLTDEEIILADDRELNQWCSLKRISQFRSKEQEEYDRKVYSRKANNLELKKTILKSVYGNKNDATNGGEEVTEPPAKKPKRGKKRRKKNKAKDLPPVSSNAVAAPPVQTNNGQTMVNKSRKRKRKPKPAQREANEISKTSDVSVDRLKAYGISNKKIKRMKLS